MPESATPAAPPEATSTNGRPRRRRDGLLAYFSRRLVRLPGMRDRLPARYRPTLFFETCYNVGTGGFLTLFLLSTVVLKTILDGGSAHLAIVAAMFGGSSLLSPVVSYVGRKVPMKSLVVIPNLLVAGLLLCTALPVAGATFFAIVIGTAFVMRVFPRVAEMNMYRVLYPASYRGTAVGWTKAVSAVAALSVTLTGYWWFGFQPQLYWVLYVAVAGLLVAGALCYARIPVRRANIFARDDRVAPHRAFLQGWKAFASDKRFVLYQVGFWLAGFANHMAMVFVAEVLTEDVIGTRPAVELLPAFLHPLAFDTLGLGRIAVVTLVVGFVFAVLPVLLMMTSAPFWGRMLDRVNPMLGRSLFNTFQFFAYGFHGWGAATMQIWPFVVGAALHAIGNGGGTINWLTGSLYFANEDQISLYNAVHVGLTGVRGMIAPVCGWWLISSAGWNIGGNLFWVASVLSLLGAAVMLVQGLTDPGPRE